MVDGKRKSVLVHRIVAMVFICLPTDKRMTVNHKNGNKRDNRLVNLEWATAIENQLHRTRVLRKAIGKDHPRAKLTEEQVQSLRREWENGAKGSDLSKKYGVCRSAVSQIVHRRNYIFVV